MNVPWLHSWENASRPIAVERMPSRIIVCGPKRSISQPWIGPSTPDSIRVSMKAKPKSVAGQRNSALSSAT